MIPIKHLAHKIAFTWLILLTATMVYLQGERYKEESLNDLEITRLSVQSGYNTRTIEQMLGREGTIKSAEAYNRWHGKRKTIKNLRTP